MNKFVRVIFILLILGPSAAAAAEYSSVYSKLDSTKDCTVFAKAPEDGGEWANLTCDGYKGYPVIVYYSDLRESLFYGFPPSGDIAPRWESFAGFNATSPTIEWRLRDEAGLKIPFATIHRWTIEEGGAPKVEVLVIEKVGQIDRRDGCMVGYVVATGNPGANEAARKIADTKAQNFNCGSDKRHILQSDVASPNLMIVDQ